MKNIVLFTAILTLICFKASSQISITKVDDTTNLSGKVVTINLDSTDDGLVNYGYILLDLQIHNKFQIQKSWRVTRKNVTVPSDWIDQLCIPGNCYDTHTDSWTTPEDNPMIVKKDTFALMNLHIIPNKEKTASSTYRYYIGDGTTFEDSVDVQVNYTLVAGLKTVKVNPGLSIAPNPANDYVIISNNLSENGTVKIIDILGNVVYTDSMIASKKIDVSDFKNGVYFITIENGNAKIANRKLVIRH